MGLLKKYTPWEQEYRRVWQQEEKYLNQYAEKKSGALRVKLEEMAPEKLVETLHGAFVKAFSLVFEKGTETILKAGGVEKKREEFLLHAYAAELREKKSTCAPFPGPPERPAGATCCFPARRASAWAPLA